MFSEPNESRPLNKKSLLIANRCPADIINVLNDTKLATVFGFKFDNVTVRWAILVERNIVFTMINNSAPLPDNIRIT